MDLEEEIEFTRIFHSCMTFWNRTVTYLHVYDKGTRGTDLDGFNVSGMLSEDPLAIFCSFVSLEIATNSVESSRLCRRYQD